MKASRMAGFAFLLFFSISALKAQAQTDPFILLRNLSLGSYGEDVRQLQIFLNKDPGTRIQDAGPGSPGQETQYFGLLTRDAVIRFQEKNADKILYLNGLSAGTGVVGPSTRAVLSSASPDSSKADAPKAPPIISVASPVPTASVAKPNQKNLDKFIGAINKLGARQNIPPAVLTNIKDQVTKDAATTTDLRATFLKLMQSKSKPSSMDDSFLGKALATIENAFDRIFRPEKALAAAGTPFGGELLYPFFCTCSYTWLIFMEPLPPSYAYLLTYTPFSEAYLSYNIPYTQELLGTYQAGAGECLIYYGYGCITIPSEGMITPLVGSSAS